MQPSILQSVGARREVAPLASAVSWRLVDAGQRVEVEAQGTLRRLFDGLPEHPRTLPELLERLAGPAQVPLLLELVRAVAVDRVPRSCLHRAPLLDRGRMRLETRVFAEPGHASLCGITAPAPAAQTERALAQRTELRTLRRRVHDLHAVLDSLAESVLLQSPDGETTFINRAARAFLQVTDPRMSSRDVSGLFELFDARGNVLTFDDLPGQHALKGELPSPRLVHSRRLGEGEERWAIVRATPIFGPGHRVRMVVNAWSDVTAVRRAHDALRRERALLQAQSDASLDATLIVAPSGELLYMNRRFHALWGLKPTTGATSDDARALQTARDKVADPEGFVRRIQEIYASPDATSHDEVLMRDGRVLERYSAPALGEDGERYGRVWFFRDVTEAKRAEQRERLLIEERAARSTAELAKGRWQFLAEVSQRLGSSLNLDAVLRETGALSLRRLADCCFIDLLGEDGALHAAATSCADPVRNAALERLREFRGAGTPQDMAEALRTGQPQLTRLGLRPPTDPARAEDEAGFASLRISWLLTLPLGPRDRQLGTLTLGRAGAPTFADQQMAVELASRAATAIESALLYQRAQEAIGLRDDFLSVASHELRTPMTALRLSLQALMRQAEQHPERESETTDRLVRAASRYEVRLSKLVDTLLDVTRIESGNLALELEPVDLCAVAQEVVSLFQAEAARSHTAIVLQAPGPVVGHWDRSRLEQVVTNLLSNALKYGAGRPVHVEIASSQGRAQLVVRDQGIGVPVEQHEKIFGRFERAVSSRHYGGLGLGLYIVKGITEALGGKVWLKSAPGAGATFTVELPCKGPAEVGQP
ncbi:MAG: PAS domain-containing protein [Deltaproteobacteria bacterium]|nr:PAS domain-containing protein [Deltaproteobacteria bacterium]